MFTIYNFYLVFLDSYIDKALLLAKMGNNMNNHMNNKASGIALRNKYFNSGNILFINILKKFFIFYHLFGVFLIFLDF